MKENEDLMTLLDSLELSGLKEEELIMLSSFGGLGNISGNNVSWSGCSTTNNCNGGNCVSGCGSSGK